jgi:hypothetical protein
MDRRVPTIGSEEINLYIRTYYSLLRTTSEVQLRSLEEVHSMMESSLHPLAREEQADLSAFIYSSLRLPSRIIDVERIILGQSVQVFLEGGVGDITKWELVTAKARRRRTYYDGQGTLATFIASGSDIDDLLPMLTAFQIEWNKLHRHLRGDQVKRFLADPTESAGGLAVLAQGVGIPLDEFRQLQKVWGDDFWVFISAIAAGEKRFAVRLLSGSLNDYRRATQTWWDTIEDGIGDSIKRPIYFVSSNSHSLSNLVSGSGLRHEPELVEFMHQSQQEDLLAEWNDILAENVPSSKENFLYYALKKYESMNVGTQLLDIKEEEERASGIRRYPSTYGFDIGAQTIDLSGISPERVDPRLRRDDLDLLAQSDAMIVNIDYPLGMAAYLILSYIATRVGHLRGVYIMGKSASLNGVVGDVMIPSVVYDEQSKNTYLFNNCFSASHLVDDLIYGTVLDNQKAVSVRGTFLQTPRYMDVFYREGYTDIEMEAGPYLSGIYELFRPVRHPENEIVNLYGLPFDLGILHYASDTPLSKGKNLGAGSLSYFGMDPTYATSLAILKRIIDLEIVRLRTMETASPQKHSN